MKKHFTCIASNYGAPAMPATREEWQKQRESEQLKLFCASIEASTDEEEMRRLKSRLPVWTPRCASFKDNHRKESEVERPLNRMMLDIDEKGRTDEVLSHLKDGKIGIFTVHLVEESVRRGTHVMVEIPEGMTPQQVQQRFSETINIKVDPAVKNLAGCIYQVPNDHIRYISESLFEPTALTPIINKTPTTMTQNQPPAPATQNQQPTPQNLKSFDLCVEQANLKADNMDVWGEHNWHNNLMAVMSVGLPKLMSKEQLLAVVATRLQNYSQTEDCRKLIDYFYEKYSADTGYMSAALREINAKAQSVVGNNTDGDSSENGDEEEKQTKMSWNPPALPRKIPRLMELLVNNYDPRFREMLLLSALPVLSAHASHFRAVYISGKEIGPQQYVAVIGGSGQGKGNCTSLYKDMVKHTLQDNDEREWQKVKENAELRDKQANAKERPPKYHPRLRLFETTSKSSILELQNNLGKNGMLLGQFSEVDGLSNASRAAYSDISVLLRKGWDMDMHRQYYMSESTCNTYTQMSLSVLMAGTVKAMLERMFDDNNCEGGLMQRFISVLVPKMQCTFRPPKQNLLSFDEQKERDALILELYQKDLALGEGTQVLETPLTNRAIEAWYDELEMRYNDGELKEEDIKLSHRCGEFMLRAAIPLIALYGKETKEIVDFCRWVGEMAFYNMCTIFGMRMQKNRERENMLLSMHVDARRTAEPILNRMPEVFTLKQFKEERIKDGQSPDVRMLLSRYCKNGKLERVKQGIYKKLTPSQM